MTLSIGRVGLGLVPRLVGIISDEKIRTLSKDEIMKSDILELRVDIFKNKPTPEYAVRVLKEVKRKFGKPVIVTVRKVNEGGFRDIDDNLRIKILSAVIPFSDAVDIELASVILTKKIIPVARHLKKTVICSYHNFRRTPSLAGLNQILSRSKKTGADITKIAAFASQKDELIRLVDFTIRNRNKNIVTISLGRLGTISRIFNPLVGSLFTYGYIGKKSVAPGQISIGKMAEYLRDFAVR